jgi:cytochrome o ubiquinol oxidase subunit IV
MAHESASGSHGAATRRGYLTGFILALILTAIPFGAVMSHALSPTIVLSVILAAAALQILVHLHYFLHLGAPTDEPWNFPATLFTAIIIVLVVGGSIWIMSNLAGRTMDRAATATTMIDARR